MMKYIETKEKKVIFTRHIVSISPLFGPKSKPFFNIILCNGEIINVSEQQRLFSLEGNKAIAESEDMKTIRKILIKSI